MHRDLPPNWMLVKAGLFVVLATLAAGFLLWQDPSWTTAMCVTALMWSSCRAYYFLFHALQNWIDPRFRYTGLLDLMRAWRARHTSRWSRWPTSPRWADGDEPKHTGEPRN